MRTLLLLSALFCSGVSAATTVTFDTIDSAGSSTGGSFPDMISSGGFDFFTNDVLILTSGALAWGPGPMFYLEMTASDGAAFSLHSAELADWGYSITGYLVGGGTVQKNVNSGSSWTNVLFDTSWQNLESVTFTSTDAYFPRIDNIVVTSVVPIPATVWLLGSALAGLVCFRRRETV